jgi:hypothetical protein
MSKGLGQIETAIKAYFRARPYAAATVAGLAAHIYSDRGDDVPRSHRVAIIRAAKSLAIKGYPIGWLTGRRRGSQLVFYRTTNQISIARAKALCPASRNRWFDECEQLSGLPNQSRPAPSPVRRPDRGPGMVAAAIKYLATKGKPITASAIGQIIGGVIPEAEIRIILGDLRTKRARGPNH